MTPPIITRDQLRSVAKLQRAKLGDQCLLCDARMRFNPKGWLFLELVEGEPARLADWAAVAQGRAIQPPKPRADGTAAVEVLTFGRPRQRNRAHWARCVVCPMCRREGHMPLAVDHLR